MLGVCGAVLAVAGWQSAWSGGELIGVLASPNFVPQWSIGPLWLFGVAVLTHRMEKSLRGSSPVADWPRGGLKKSFAWAWTVPTVRISLIVGGLCLLMLSGIRVANWSAEPAEWDRPVGIAAVVLLGGLIASISVVLARALAQSATERRRYHEEWASLPV